MGDAETYDAGGVADGAPHVAGQIDAAVAAGAATSRRDERGIDDVAGERRSLRDYLGEQLRLSFADPVDRMIGAHLIALLCPAGRLTADPAAIADAMAVAAVSASERVRRADDALRPGRAVRARV